MAELRALFTARKTSAFACGHPMGPYVFSPMPDGAAPWLPVVVSSRFARIADRAGVDCRLHDLRHFTATNMLAAGVDVRTVAGRLGHTDGGRTTLAVYAHVLQESDQRAVDGLSDLLRRRIGNGDSR